jgi:SsrA-binding protein
MVRIINPGVNYHYQILEKFEAGIELKGFEVKAIKNNQGSLKGAYISYKNNELYLVNFNLPPYQPKNTPKDYQQDRDRKLLLKKGEINYLAGKLKEKGYTLIPLQIYSKNNLIKVEIALAKGLKKYEKKEKIKEREFRKIKSRIEKRHYLN